MKKKQLVDAIQKANDQEDGGRPQEVAVRSHSAEVRGAARRDEDQLGLPVRRGSSTPSPVTRDALLDGHAHELPAPLRHRHPHAQLQRLDGVGVHRRSRRRPGRRPAGPTGRSPARRRARGSRPGGSRRRRRCPRPRRRAGGGEHLVAGAAGRERRRGEVLHPVADGQRRAQAGRRRRLAGPQHVGRCAGCRCAGPGWSARRRSARGRPARSPRRSGRRAAACRARRPAAIPARCRSTRRLEPGVDAEVGEALADPPGDVERGRRPDLDHGGGEGLVDRPRGPAGSGARSAAISSGSRVSSQPTARSLGRDAAGRRRGPAPRTSSPCSVCESPSAWAKDGGDVDADPRAGRPARRSGGPRPTATASDGARRRRRATRRAANWPDRVARRPPPAVTPSSLRCSTRIVRRRADSQVAGSRVGSTGSSLYSRPTTSHRSMPARSISPGRTSSSRWVSQRSRTSACSRSGSGNDARGVRRGQRHAASEAELRPAVHAGAGRSRSARGRGPSRGRRLRVRHLPAGGQRGQPRPAVRAGPAAATRSRPCCLASYIAASARSTSRHRASAGPRRRPGG